MRSIGRVTNQGFDGFYFILCDATLKFGGWDHHQDFMIDEQVQLELGGQKACIVGSGDAGALQLFEDEAGMIYATQPRDGGVPAEGIDRTPRESNQIGIVDVPSGELVVALAYPPLNMTTTGDFEGVEHAEKEILRFPGRPRQLSLALEWVEGGWRFRIAPLE